MKLFFAQLPGATRFFAHVLQCSAFRLKTQHGSGPFRGVGVRLKTQHGSAPPRAVSRTSPLSQPALQIRYLALREPKRSREPRFSARIPPESFLTLHAARVRTPQPLSKHEATASGRCLGVKSHRTNRGPGRCTRRPPEPPGMPSRQAHGDAGRRAARAPIELL